MPLVRAGAIEQDNGASGPVHAGRRALALDTLDLERRVAGHVLGHSEAVNRSVPNSTCHSPILGLKADIALNADTIAGELASSVPGSARQSTPKQVDGKSVL